MVWKIVPKEEKVKLRFALFPKKIQGYYVWLQRYAVVYDYLYSGIYSAVTPNYFLNKQDAESYLKNRDTENERWL